MGTWTFPKEEIITKFPFPSKVNLFVFKVSLDVLFFIKHLKFVFALKKHTTVCHFEAALHFSNVFFKAGFNFLPSIICSLPPYFLFVKRSNHPV